MAVPGSGQRGFPWSFEASQWQAEGAQLCPVLSKCPSLPCTPKMLFPAEGFAIPLTVKAARVGQQGRDLHQQATSCVSPHSFCKSPSFLGKQAASSGGQQPSHRGLPSLDQCSRGDPSTSQLEQGSFCSSPLESWITALGLSERDQLLNAGTFCHCDNTVQVGGRISRGTPASHQSQGQACKEARVSP